MNDQESNLLNWQATSEKSGPIIKIFGITLPTLTGYRYESKKNRKRIEVWEDRGRNEKRTGGYVMELGTKFIREIAQLPEQERFQRIIERVNTAKARKSERGLANQ